MKQVIFIHIPRTAGKSITKFGKTHSPSFQKYIKEQWEPTGQFTTLRHRSPGWYLKKGLISQEWWDQSIKLAVVRNPWDRLVSLFEYLRGFRPKRRMRKSNQFLFRFDWFANEITSGSKLVASIGKNNTRQFSQANPQVEWLRWGVDRVLRFEQLNDDWLEFCREIGFPIKPLPHQHGNTNRTDHRLYYDEDLKRKVGEFYWEDIERFGYEFEEVNDEQNRIYPHTENSRQVN